MNASSIIAQHKDAIIDRWVVKVKQEISAAREYGRPILKNNVPDLLDALVNALESDDAREVVYRSESHGKDRAEATNYSLVQVLQEYRLLKEVMFTVLDEHGDNIKTRARDGIMFAIDQAVEQATSVFYKERTREMQDARDEAEELSQKLEEQGVYRDRFVATLTHDLRGPLNNTLQLLDLLEDKLPDDDALVNKVLDKIKVSLKRGNQLIDNLLDVKHIQAGNALHLNREKSDLLPMIHEVVDNLDVSSRKRIFIESDADQVVGYWDRDALRRAMDNLVSNAFKYGMEDGDIRVSVAQDSAQTVMSVHNYGNTIPPEKLDKLFDPYYRAQDVKGQLGWGLGLTLVKGVAEALGGRVEVQSNAERGTTFRIILPD